MLFTSKLNPACVNHGLMHCQPGNHHAVHPAGETRLRILAGTPTICACSNLNGRASPLEPVASDEAEQKLLQRGSGRRLAPQSQSPNRQSHEDTPANHGAAGMVATSDLNWVAPVCPKMHSTNRQQVEAKNEFQRPRTGLPETRDGECILRHFRRGVLLVVCFNMLQQSR